MKSAQSVWVRSLLTGAALATPLALTACSGGGVEPPAQVDAATLVQMSPTADGKAGVDPNLPVVVTARNGGRLTDVTVVADNGRHVAGTLAADGRSWHSSSPLAIATHYTVRVTAADGDGRGSVQRDFTTLNSSALLTATMTPGDHAVYGVGEPLTVALSAPVHDPAARKVVERALTVRSTPQVVGGWYWVDDKTLHFRPQSYWPTHATIAATFDLGGAQVQKGLYGGARASVAFRTGDRMIAVTDAASDYLTVYKNGQEIRSIPVTTGKPGFSTRNGIKVVLEQSQEVFMNSSTVGIAADSPNAYHLDVYWDTRVTWSGEFVHAAPWSVGSQGVSNVSHGCTGMSTGNAEWFYNAFRRGDLVQVINSEGHQMEPFGNGFGDWNLTWSAWQQGSALGGPLRTAPVTAADLAAATASASTTAASTTASTTTASTASSVSTTNDATQGSGASALTAGFLRPGT